MKLFAYQGKHSNFGDALNAWLWPRLLPGFFDEEGTTLFLGIGSVLYDSHPKESLKIVFGAGYAGYTPPPAINERWKIYFLRGPQTARQLGLPEALGIGDSGILIRSVLDYEQREIRHAVSYMPHFESVLVGDWEAVCARAGIRFIDPRWPVERVLQEMLASGMVIAEAMHGVVIADALRIPWRAILPYDPNHRAKWLDWAEALGLTVDFTALGPSCLLEWMAGRFWRWRKRIYFLRRHRVLFKRFGGTIPMPGIAEKLRRTATLSGQLSADADIAQAHTRMLEELERLKRDFPPKAPTPLSPAGIQGYKQPEHEARTESGTRMASVDVIILSWDRLEDTLEAIESALAQTGVDLQVIVVDQGSKPESLQRLQAFCAGQEKVRLFCNRENNGVPGGRNQASFAGQGQYIVALDNDAVFSDAQQLARTAALMEADETLGVLAYRIKLHAEDRDDRSSWPYTEKLEEASTRAFDTVRFVGAGHAIRRAAFEKVGGYDAALFFLHEEVDLAKRIINAGYRIRYTPEISVRHKVSPEHRVSWTGKRYYFDMRNRLYLHIKHRTPLPTLLFHTGLMVVKGFRSGFARATLQGLGGALGMLPAGLRHRRQDPYVTGTEASRAYWQACYPHTGQSALARIRMRLRAARG